MDTLKGRKFMIVQNNPTEYGIDKDVLISKLSSLLPTYYCFGLEIGENGTPHYHIVVHRESTIRFRTLKKLFPNAHIDILMGTVLEGRDYVRKEGKWAGTSKAETSVEGTFYEEGIIPPNEINKEDRNTYLRERIKEGASNIELIEEDPSNMYRLDKIDAVRKEYFEDEYKTKMRKVEVSYIYGATGTGKTYGIMNTYGAENVYRVTDYSERGMFDGYRGQKVLVFEEFIGQISIQRMLNYLDIYPLMLPARYYNRVACYTEVFMTSNVPLSGIYKDIQAAYPETWSAFLRRIHNINLYLPDRTVVVEKGISKNRQKEVFGMQLELSEGDQNDE